MKKKFFLLLLIFIILFCAIFYLLNEKRKVPLSPHLTINDKRISLTIADTQDEQAQGLSYQKSLDKNAGMLFIFPDKQIRSFWMKDMNFPLDIIWINDYRIEKIDKNLPPAGAEPAKNYSSNTPIDHVLEVNAGYCEQNNIKVGDEVRYFLD